MVTPQDVAYGLPWYRDPEVLEGSEGPQVAPYDAAQVEGMYHVMMARGEAYIAEVHREDRWVPIGDCALQEDALPINIGVPEFRSKGYGRRILRLLICRARQLGWSKLVVRGVYTYNVRSRRMYEGAGFRIVDTHSDEQGQQSWRMEFALPD